MFTKKKLLRAENLRLRNDLRRKNELLSKYLEQTELCSICEHARPVYQTTEFPYITVYYCEFKCVEVCKDFKAIERCQAIEKAQIKSAQS